MKTELNLGNVERRVFHSFWQDGLLDIVAGASVVLIGIGWLVDLFVPMLGVPMIAFFVWQAVRRTVTEPRLGSVVFSANRRREMTHGLIAILSLGLVVGGSLVTRIWFGEAHTPFARWFAPAIPVTILAAMSLSCAVALGLWRFVGYAVIFALSGLAVAAMESEPWWGLILGGAIVTICGAIIMSRFIHKFPRLSHEQAEV